MKRRRLSLIFPKNENYTSDPPYQNSPTSPFDNRSLSWAAGNTSDMPSGNGKRPLCGDGACLAANKLSKQANHNVQSSSFEEIGFSASEEMPAVAAEDLKLKGQGAAPVTELGTSQDIGSDPHVRMPSYPSTLEILVK
ncbi:hypothetical protein MUK42_35969 [Musa troglodytarum]|uniref:Uncharacterized protein n=1 Tax=Musa troglodytarum TaxID=320322 RepID=A0A9E7EAL0_9LILI|nr:hypothetical protein MUK42_35969 [Musa troglodytarum]